MNNTLSTDNRTLATSKITMTKNDNLTVADGIYLFLRKCRVKNLAEHSINSYEKKLIHFREFFNEKALLSSITADTIDDYILWLKDNTEANDITVNSYLRSLRAFLYYCMECGYVSNFKIHLIKAEKKIKETYTDEELSKLLEKPDVKKCSFSTFKTWAFINYCLGTGNRLSTALNVHISDIDFDNSIITLRKTKNRKQQIIPLANSLAITLKEYLEYRGGEPEDMLFCNEYGEQASERSYQQLVRRYNIKHGVNRTSIHTFRHTYAKHYILAGGDIVRLSKLMGHSGIEVTKEYLQMFGKDLQVDYDRFNPLNRLTGQA